MTKPIMFWQGYAKASEPHAFLSNFYHKAFTAPDRFGKNREFQFSEQYFMYLKALAFNDNDTADHIANHPELKPQDYKRLGRQLKHYDIYGPNWEETKVKTMTKAVFYKFQDPQLRHKLLVTGDAQLIEASPYDRYWGAGLKAQDILDRNKTARSHYNLPGKNMLGQILVGVRTKLNKEN